MIDYKFSLELTKNGIQKSIHAKAGESNSRKLVITLTESGKVYELNGINAEVFFEDGSRAINSPVRVNNTFEFVLPSGLLTKEGVRICELKIKHDEEIIFSPMFEVVVEKSFGNVSGTAEGVGEAVRYQEEITKNTEEMTELTDNDSLLAYDYQNDKVKRFRWSNFWQKYIAKIQNMIPNFATVEEKLLKMQRKSSDGSVSDLFSVEIPVVSDDSNNSGSSGGRTLKRKLFLNDFNSLPTSDSSWVHQTSYGDVGIVKLYIQSGLSYDENLDGYLNEVIGKEIKCIEYGFVVPDDNSIKWIDIREFGYDDAACIAVYSRAGEFYSMGMVNFGCVLYYGNGINKYMAEIQNQNQYGFRVTYYTDDEPIVEDNANI